MSHFIEGTVYIIQFSFFPPPKAVAERFLITRFYGMDMEINEHEGESHLHFGKDKKLRNRVLIAVLPVTIRPSVIKKKSVLNHTHIYGLSFLSFKVMALE